MWMRLLRKKYASVASRVPIQSNNDFFSKRFSSILFAFIEGYNSVLEQNKLDLSLVKHRLDDEFEEFYRGFAYEGLGMGLGARSFFHWGERKSFERNIEFISPQYLYQYYVGLGWWLSTRYGFNPEGYRRYLRTLSPYYSPIVYDGIGFKTGLFRFAKQPDITKKFALFGGVEERVCYQGLGRSLWFLAEFNIMRVLHSLEKIPVCHRPDTISGVGLAVAYSMYDDIGLANQLNDFLPVELRSAYAQGLAFGWEARTLQTKNYQSKLLEYGERLAGPVLAYIHAVHTVRHSLLQQKAKDFYVNWVDGVRDILAKKL